jgi:two-component system, NtrC family, response regulator AtoC
MNTILVAEDELEIRNYLGLALRCHGYQVQFAQDGQELVDHLERNAATTSLLLLDLIMPRKDGFEALKRIRQDWPSLPVIALSGSCTPANVASVLKSGAIDFLAKPINHEELLKAVREALAPTALSKPAIVPTRAALSNSHVSSTGMWLQKVELLVKQLANSDVPVLVRGETGVGKEVLARKLHEASKRAGRPFLKLNCAALPSELVESELFGYEKGAFTGAFKNTPGKFELANGGTILLDEIGDMDFKLQAKLLQVLQDREFIRLGAKDPSRVDVRVMAATHCDLEKAMIEGRFRQDLYYRLNIVELHVPPLRERRDEILPLAEALVQRHSAGDDIEITPQMQDALMQHEWPGNVRELENVLRKFLVFRSPDLIVEELERRRRQAADRRNAGAIAPPQDVAPAQTSLPVPYARVNFEERIPAPTVEPVQTLSSDQVLGRMTLAYNGTAAIAEVVEMPLQGIDSSVLAKVDHARKKAETEAILSALNTTLWNRKQAAKLLKIDYKALLYKMKKLGIGEERHAVLN